MVVAEKTAANSPHYTCSADADILNHRVQGNRKFKNFAVQILKKSQNCLQYDLNAMDIVDKIMQKLILIFFVEFTIISELVR